MGNALTRLAGWVLALAAAILPVAAIAQEAPPAHVALVPLSHRPAPGETMPLAIVITPPPGWHTYWQNPGDTGYPPRFAWHLPTGLSVDGPAYPVPERLDLGGIAANVQDGRSVLLAGLKVPAGLRDGVALPVSAMVDLLVCSASSCVPQSRHVALALHAGDGRPDPAAGVLIAEASRALPRLTAAGATFSPGRQSLRLDLPLPLAVGSMATVFPIAADGGVPGIAQVVAADAAHATLDVPLGSLKPAGAYDLVVTAQGAQGGWQVHAVRSARPAATRGGGLMWLGALAGAVLGGLLLNLMPCVFPILSLKAMALVRSGAGAREAQMEATGYLLGATATMMALGAAVLGLRAGGAAVGWAFQLQNPAFVAVLLVLVLAIALNLAGLFELPALGVAVGRREGLLGGVGTGALAAFVATPCTGPFMAGALGAALVLPPLAAMAVFAGLGLGFALPFLAIGFWEPARRRMPKPGTWMVTLRHLLSLPMFATALALAWLVGMQAGITAMSVALAAALIAGLALWWMGLHQRASIAAWPALAGLATAVAVATVGVSGAVTSPSQTVNDRVLAYDAARLARLRADHRPVLVYATAAWCLTCKVNEASSLAPARIRATFAAHGAVMMEADWTRNAPEVTQLLTANGRAGVPLYLWYPSYGAPRTLPQVLTPGLVLGLVER